MRCSAVPEDLVAAQYAWERTYRSLADPANRQRTTALRRRLLELSVQVWWHPYWQQAGNGQRCVPRRGSWNQGPVGDQPAR